jgi:hypothetical protein
MVHERRSRELLLHEAAGQEAATFSLQVQFQGMMSSPQSDRSRIFVEPCERARLHAGSSISAEPLRGTVGAEPRWMLQDLALQQVATVGPLHDRSSG